MIYLCILIILIISAFILYILTGILRVRNSEMYYAGETELAQAQQLQQSFLPSDDSLTESGATYMELHGIESSGNTLPPNDPFYETPPSDWEAGVV